MRGIWNMALLTTLGISPTLMARLSYGNSPDACPDGKVVVRSLRPVAIDGRVYRFRGFASRQVACTDRLQCVCKCLDPVHKCSQCVPPAIGGDTACTEVCLCRRATLDCPLGAPQCGALGGPGGVHMTDVCQARGPGEEPGEDGDEDEDGDGGSR